MGCFALVACVNLTPPWERHRDAGRPDRAGDSTLPPAGPDAGADNNLPVFDADQATNDAPGPEDGSALGDSGSLDGLWGRDGVGERADQGDVRIDGGTTDGARTSGDASDSDARLAKDGEGARDSASDVLDASTSDLPLDANRSPDAGNDNVAKLTGRAFGTGPAFSSHPTATYDKAFDGDPTTFFDDSHSGGGYAGIDVGGAVVVRAVRYHPREDYNDRMVGGKFQCSPSSQSSGYVDLFTVTSVPPLAWTKVSVTAAPACRYFRYLAPADSFSNVGEIEFWTADEPDGGSTAGLGGALVNLALGQPASASSEQISTRKFIANGNDGLISTVFCPADDSFPVWYQVDLGAVHDIQQTDITVEAAPPAYQYQIDVSLDGAQWTTTVAHLSGAVGGRSTLSDDFQAQARYVRVTFTGVSNNIWGCLREFMVWGYAEPSTDGGVERD